MGDQRPPHLTAQPKRICEAVNRIGIWPFNAAPFQIADGTHAQTRTHGQLFLGQPS
jgi:hypothetical protein